MKRSVPLGWVDRLSKQYFLPRFALGAALLAVGVAMVAAMGPLSGLLELVALGAAALFFLAFGLMAPWLVETRDRRYSGYYRGCYPPFPDEGYVTLTVNPEELVVSFRKGSVRRVLPYRRLLNVHVAAGKNNFYVLTCRLQDNITNMEYDMAFALNRQDADDLLRAILRRRDVEVNSAWALWRMLEVEMPLSSGELLEGTKRLVRFKRQVACVPCHKTLPPNPACRTCAGKGARVESDMVEVVIHPGTAHGTTVQYAEMGNEDINGQRGPLTVCVERASPVVASPG